MRLASIYVLCVGTEPPSDVAEEDQRPCSEFHKLGRMSYLRLRGRGDAFETECLDVELPPKRAPSAKVSGGGGASSGGGGGGGGASGGGAARRK